jgi:hypothetical protein
LAPHRVFHLRRYARHINEARVATHNRAKLIEHDTGRFMPQHSTSTQYSVLSTQHLFILI